MNPVIVYVFEDEIKHLRRVNKFLWTLVAAAGTYMALGYISYRNRKEEEPNQKEE